MLNGLSIVNTRPEFQDANKRLSEKILNLGGKVMSFPLQDITPISSDEWIKDLPPLEHISFAIFVSVPAVHFFFKGLQKHKIAWPEQLQVIAIGSATALALKKLGLEYIHFSEHGTSDHLLSIPQLRHIQNQHILWIKGPHGRRIIGDEIRERGANLTALNVYESQDIFYTEEQLATLWQTDKIDIILISSLKALHCLWKQIPESKKTWFQTIPLLVFSERIKKEAEVFLNNPMFTSKHDKIIETLQELYQNYFNHKV